MDITVYKCSREACPCRDALIDPYEYFDDKILYLVNHCRGLCKVVIDDDKWDRDVDYTYKSIIDRYDLYEYEKGYLLAMLIKFKHYLEEAYRQELHIGDLVHCEECIIGIPLITGSLVMCNGEYWPLHGYCSKGIRRSDDAKIQTRNIL